MNKQELVRFINKYYLNGVVNSVVLNSKSDTQVLSTRFISGDKTLLGDLTVDKWDFEDSDVGIYNTEQLLKLLSVMDNDIQLSLSKSGSKSLALKVSDSSSSINYMLSGTNRVTIPVNTSKVSDIENVSFNANMFKEVLSANKECESATLEVSSEGLSKISFKVDNFTATYWLVAVSDSD